MNTLTRNTSTLRPLDDEQIAQLAAALDEQWEFRIEQVVELDAPDAERYESPATRAINRRILLAAWAVLADMRAARERLADGTYGRCVKCTDRVPLERLKAMPHTALCEPCLRSTTL